MQLAKPVMRMERLRLEGLAMRWCETRMTITNKSDGTSKPLRAGVIKVDNESTLGYIPTKCWYDHANAAIVLLYYISSALPNAARPFGNKPCYIYTVKTTDYLVVEYDAETRIFIDQVATDEGMMYMFIFGEDDMQKVLTTHWDGRSWEEANPVLAEWNALAGESAGEDVGDEWIDPDGGK